jgi:hypothetical protein
VHYSPPAGHVISKYNNIAFFIQASSRILDMDEYGDLLQEPLTADGLLDLAGLEACH